MTYIPDNNDFFAMQEEEPILETLPKTNRDKIEYHLRQTEREGVEELVSYLLDCGYYEAPCSTRYHLAKEGGLAEHSLNVLSLATKLMMAWEVQVPYSSVVIVSLLHDLGKTGHYDKPFYIPNMVREGRATKSNPDPKWIQSSKQPYESNKQMLGIPHEIITLTELSRHFTLTEEEYFAILYHNGLYGDLKYQISGKETPLYMLLHFADMWASRVTEVMEVENGEE